MRKLSATVGVVINSCTSSTSSIEVSSFIWITAVPASNSKAIRQWSRFEVCSVWSRAWEPRAMSCLSFMVIMAATVDKAATTTIIVAMLLSVLLFSVLLLVWFCLLSLHDYRGGANSLLRVTADVQQRTEPMVLKRAPRVPSSTRARYGDD